MFRSPTTADIAVTELSITNARHSVVDFTFPALVVSTTWLTKAPDKVRPYRNLITTMDTGCWISTLVSVASMSLALLLTVRVGKSYGMPQPDMVKIFLTPFALLNAEGMPSWFNTVGPTTRYSTRLSGKGRAGNLLLLTWSVMGMIIMFGATCNLRAIYMRVDYEKPLDTARSIYCLLYTSDAADE